MSFTVITLIHVRPICQREVQPILLVSRSIDLVSAADNNNVIAITAVFLR